MLQLSTISVDKHSNAAAQSSNIKVRIAVHTNYAAFYAILATKSLNTASKTHIRK
jgi:hypothetical protein